MTEIISWSWPLIGYVSWRENKLNFSVSFFKPLFWLNNLLYPRSIQKKCQQKVFTKSVHKKFFFYKMCPQTVSTKSVCRKCHKNKSLYKHIHKKCPQAMSTKKIPKKMFMKSVHNKIMSRLECNRLNNPKTGAFESLGYANLSCHPPPTSALSY